MCYVLSFHVFPVGCLQMILKCCRADLWENYYCSVGKNGEKDHAPMRHSFGFIQEFPIAING